MKLVVALALSGLVASCGRTTEPSDQVASALPSGLSPSASVSAQAPPVASVELCGQRVATDATALTCDVVVSDLRPLAALTELERLVFRGTVITDDVSAIGQLERLKVLRVKTSSVADLSPLGRLQHLEELRFYTRETPSLDPLARLGSLRVLHIAEVPISDVTPLAKLAHLEVLDLGFTRVDDVSALGALKNLRDLGLSGTRVTDISPLEELPQLQTLRIVGLDVSEPSVRALKARRPTVTILR